MRVSAKVDYAIRAAVELAAFESENRPVKGEVLSGNQQIPLKFLESILSELRHAGIVRSQRGAEGGYWLAKPSESVTLADIIRAVEGPLATVRGELLEQGEYLGTAKPLAEVWVAVRVSLRNVLEHVTLADLAKNQLPEFVSELTDQQDAWLTR